MRTITAIGVISLLACVTASFAQQRIEISTNSRYLRTADGQPFFWLADTAWELYRLSPDELDVYFANRAAKGFNVIQGPFLLTGSANYAGENNPDPTNLSGPWFDHVDMMVNKAAQHGLYIAPVLAHSSMVGQLTEQNGYAYGHFVGQRYRDDWNIAAFLIGAEFNFPQANTAIWNEVARGVQDGLAGRAVLMTAHPRWFGGYGGQTSSAALHDEPWLSFNMLQSSLYGDCTNDPAHSRYLGVHNWLLIEYDYALSPTKPVLDGEATYEQQSPDHPSCSPMNPPRWHAFGVRRRAYWSVFAGGFGHTYGANGVFQFHKQDDPNTVWAPLDYWDVAMDYPGAFQMGHLRALMESRPFFSRVPAPNLLIPTPDPDVPGHVHATRDSNGRYAFIYIPEVPRSVTIDTTLLSGPTFRAWWFSPVDGSATLLDEFGPGDLGPGGTLTLTSPASGDDWVLVVDDASAGFGPPGVPLPAPSPDFNGDGLVNVSDLLIMLSEWGDCATCQADLNGDGTVDVLDLLQLLHAWG